jgi:MFS family permease
MFYKASAHPIAATWVTMGLLYFVFMMFGVFTIRVPQEGWKPEGWVPRATRSTLISTHKVDVNAASRTPQFWLLWVILCMNVTAGIGILEQASPMIQDLFRGRVSAIAAAGFVGLLSLFNMGGRFVWASMSDFIGRKTTYFVFFVLGMLLYLALPFTGNTHLNSVPLFVLIAGLLISMYGGGFATIPAYLKDLFGSYHVSAIHGRLLTAWSTAGIVGPLIVNGVLDHYVANHLPKQQAYPVILHIMAGLMVVGFIANLLVRPVVQKYWLESASSQVRAAR